MKRYREALAYSLAGLLIGWAFLVPGTTKSVFLGWIGATLLLALARREVFLLRGLFLFGFILSTIGFHWLPYTIHQFGGFGTIGSSALFTLFCAASALQFVLCGIIYRRLAQTILQNYLLAFGFSWLSAQFIFPQLFPWTISHTQLAWHSFSMLAQYVGIYTLDLLMFIWIEAVLRMFDAVRKNDLSFNPIVACGVLSTVFLLFGSLHTDQVLREIAQAPTVKVGLIQGNLSTKVKGDFRYLEANLQTYQRLSEEASAKGAELVVWPETVMNSWIPSQVGSVTGQKFDPWPNKSRALLFGALTFSERSNAERMEIERAIGAGVDDEYTLYRRYNGALGINHLGTVEGRYEKQILMPFGEYLPFAETFPFLRKLSPNSGSFDLGPDRSPISLRAGDSSRGGEVRVQPLICYEDIVSSVSREGAKAGAWFLVNLTNDAWYGKTIAPYQHHLLASWRAIETRRPLVRVTNTGLTAVVDPLGRTTARLPIFQEGYLVEAVPLMRKLTPYTLLGERLNYALVVLALAFALVRQRSAFAESTASAKSMG